jgi:hypothetical protein
VGIAPQRCYQFERYPHQQCVYVFAQCVYVFAQCVRAFVPLVGASSGGACANNTQHSTEHSALRLSNNWLLTIETHLTHF